MTAVQFHQVSKEGVSFTKEALKHFQKQLEKTESAAGLRLSLKKTGCSGLSYVFDCVDAKESEDLVYPFSKTHALFIDKKAWPMVKGLQVDFVTSGLQQKLVFKNPNERGVCGCGESFTVDQDQDK